MRSERAHLKAKVEHPIRTKDPRPVLQLVNQRAPAIQNVDLHDTQEEIRAVFRKMTFNQAPHVDENTNVFNPQCDESFGCPTVAQSTDTKDETQLIFPMYDDSKDCDVFEVEEAKSQDTRSTVDIPRDSLN